MICSMQYKLITLVRGLNRIKMNNSEAKSAVLPNTIIISTAHAISYIIT